MGMKVVQAVSCSRNCSSRMMLPPLDQRSLGDTCTWSSPQGCTNEMIKNQN